MTTSCAIVDCSVKDGAKIAQGDRKVIKWLPVGPLPEGMAFSGSLQCRICRSCFQRINRYQSEERERREGQPTLRSQVPLPTPSQKARKQDEVSSLRSSSASTEQLPTDDDSAFQQSAFDHRHHWHHLLRRPPPRQLPSSYEAPWNCHRRRNALGLRTNFLGHQDSTQEA